jgi:hypothetical protein
MRAKASTTVAHSIIFPVETAQTRRALPPHATPGLRNLLSWRVGKLQTHAC